MGHIPAQTTFLISFGAKHRIDFVFQVGKIHPLTLVVKLRTWQRSFCAGNGAERHRLPPLGKLRALSLSKRQAARRVAVATASNLSFVVRGRAGSVTGDW